MDRRQFLLGLAAVGAGLASAPRRPRQRTTLAPARDGPGPYGPLQPADANGVQLPAGFRSRVVARSGERVEGTDHTWHELPDGGATFDDGDGGWIYVSNCEADRDGGVGALRFAPDGTIAAAYPILTGAVRNCAGGPTPWGTWLSCEEAGDGGRVWECDPLGERPAEVHLAMGLCNHEAAAVDPAAGVVYLTEDTVDGCYYRYRPAAYPVLAAGVLEAAALAPDGATTWVPVPDPTGPEPIRAQAQRRGATPFRGGEGCWYDAGHVFFTTKRDHRVWDHDLAAERITILYARTDQGDAVLDGVDNITVGRAGDLFVAEDKGDMELALIEAGTLAVSPFLRIPDHIGSSEVAGPAFDPSGGRLYLSSQRGDGGGGVTYEVTGPFR